MKALEKCDVEKIGTVYRVLAFFISVTSFLAIFGFMLFAKEEEIGIGSIVILLMPLILLVVCLPISITGYPPHALRWTMKKAK